MHSRPFPAKNADEIGVRPPGDALADSRRKCAFGRGAPATGQVSPIQFAVISFEEDKGDHEREWCGQRGERRGWRAVSAGRAASGRQFPAPDDPVGGRFDLADCNRRAGAAVSVPCESVWVSSPPATR